MREFSKLLSRLLTEHEMTQAQFGAISHMDDAKVSRLINSVNRPSVEDVHAAIDSFRSVRDKFRLAVAHIQDELPPDLFQKIKLDLVESSLGEGPNVLAIRTAIDYILREHGDNEHLAPMFLGMAKLMGWRDPKAKSNKYPPQQRGD